jgi:hypothetical protein
VKAEAEAECSGYALKTPKKAISNRQLARQNVIRTNWQSAKLNLTQLGLMDISDTYQ